MLARNWTTFEIDFFICYKGFSVIRSILLLSLFERVKLGNVVIITDRISVIMQVYQQSFFYRKQCGRRKRIEGKTSLTR